MERIWVPTLSIKMWRLHAWFGCGKSDGRKIYAVIEETEEPRIEFKLHWLSWTRPMFALWLFPALGAHAFWYLQSHDHGGEG